jgi:hypothetical protein
MQNHINPCLGERQHFTYFVVLFNGMLGKETHILIKNLTGYLPSKSGKQNIPRPVDLFKLIHTALLFCVDCTSVSKAPELSHSE